MLIRNDFHHKVEEYFLSSSNFDGVIDIINLINVATLIPRNYLMTMNKTSISTICIKIKGIL